MELYNINSEKFKDVGYFEYHTLEREVSLFEFAKKNNINPDLLAALNGLEPGSIFIKSQMILLPKNGFSYYITKAGDTLSNVANIFNTSIDNIIKNNSIIYLLDGQLLVDKVK